MLVTGVGLLLIAVAAAFLLRGRRLPPPVDPGRVEVPQATVPVVDDPAPVAAVDPPQHWARRDIPEGDARAWSDLGFDADHAFLLRSLGVTITAAGGLQALGLDNASLLALVEQVGVEHATACADAGFTPDAAAAWRSAGWTVDDALPWFAARFEPESAAAWREQGFDADIAATWKGEHFGVKQAVEWRRLGDTPAEARAVEQKLGEARVTIADALRWLDRGFSLDEICDGWVELAAGDSRSWRAQWQGLSLSPAELSAWCERFEQEEALRWVDAGVRDPRAAARLRSRGVDPERVQRVANNIHEVFDVVPVTRDDLLSAAGQLARAGGSPDVRHRLQIAASKNPNARPQEVPAALIEDVLDEFGRLERQDAFGAPHAARALARRLEEGLIVSTLITGRGERVRAGSPNK